MVRKGRAFSMLLISEDGKSFINGVTKDSHFIIRVNKDRSNRHLVNFRIIGELEEVTLSICSSEGNASKVAEKVCNAIMSSEKISVFRVGGKITEKK